MSTNIAWIRGSPVISGWNDVASRLPCRTATILPTAPAAPRARPTPATTSTAEPTFSTHGARMNTAWNGRCDAVEVDARSASNESTWRPNALRRTTTSSPPNVSWPAVPASMWSASMIIPAQVPNAGSPAVERARGADRAARTSRASLDIVVDSPPGITIPSTPFELFGAAHRGRARPRALEHRAGAPGRRPGAPARRSWGPRSWRDPLVPVGVDLDAALVELRGQPVLLEDTEHLVEQRVARRGVRGRCRATG